MNPRFLLAQKIGKQPEDMAPFVIGCLDGTQTSSSRFNEFFGPLSGHITPKEFEEFFIHFCKGVQYVHEKYGTVMDNWLVGNREQARLLKMDSDICYMDGTVVNGNRIDDTVIITREFIGEWAIAKRSNPTDTSTGHLSGLTLPELATALGVEEAYHAYQLKVLYPELRSLTHEEKQRQLEEIRAKLEAELKSVSLQAAKDLGFGNTHAVG